MSFRLDLDVESLMKVMSEKCDEVQKRLETETANLAAMTHARILEKAQQQLHSSRKQYVDALRIDFETAGDIWVVSLDDSANWIEEGLPENFDMKPGLLNGEGVKVSKDGHKYKVVHFDWSKGPKNMDKNSRDMLAQVKSAVRKFKNQQKKSGVEFGKKGIMLGADGKTPKIGKIAEFDIDSRKPTKAASTAALKGLTIYQHMKTGANGKQTVHQQVVTFRTVSDGPASDGKWIHPGVQPKHFFDEAYEWAKNEWETNIKPKILKDFEG